MKKTHGEKGYKSESYLIQAVNTPNRVQIDKSQYAISFRNQSAQNISQLIPRLGVAHSPTYPFICPPLSTGANTADGVTSNLSTSPSWACHVTRVPCKHIIPRAQLCRPGGILRAWPVFTIGAQVPLFAANVCGGTYGVVMRSTTALSAGRLLFAG
jgi:hypothetical protein